MKRTVPYVTKGKWNLKLPDNKPKFNTLEEWRTTKGLDPWKRQMFALKEKFPEGWAPKKRLSREKMEELKERRRLEPSLNNTQLGNIYRISPEAVRRILKSQWEPSAETSKRLEAKWKRRGERLAEILE
ncbi:Rrg9 protein [Starmerella bacillaris]|uniref:Required for respiratory growth protein 9, mitochondrial n=1 Tax=Starmerella bacillaris TaxID=1247836 RepID=A0AAV5RCP1_STABA|nr:Rrg9 protein [Starmerella bacillaris]